MKKLLLTLVGAALSLCASAADDSVVINFGNATADNVTGTFFEESYKADSTLDKRAHWEPVESITLNNYTFTVTAAEDAQNAPALYFEKTTTKRHFAFMSVQPSLSQRQKV